MSLMLKAGDAHNAHKPVRNRDRKSFGAFLDDHIESFKTVGKEFCTILMMILNGKIKPNTPNAKYEQIISHDNNIKEGEDFLNELLRESGSVLDQHPIYGNLLRLVINAGIPKATMTISAAKIGKKNMEVIKKHLQFMQRSEKGGILIAPSNDSDTKQDNDNDNVTTITGVHGSKRIRVPSV